MFVKCINVDDIFGIGINKECPLTIRKIYKVISIIDRDIKNNGELYEITSDYGNELAFFAWRFENVRNEIIDNIVNEKL